MRTDYDSFADAYQAENEGSLLNAYYERPAMLDLVGDGDGRDVLDVGCGAGPLAEQLIARGARVTGFDASARMIELAGHRLGGDVELQVADLGEPLRYDDDSFDLACASLVLHYLEDWVGPLTEIRRVLRPGGKLVASINHPLAYALYEKTYFGVRQYEFRSTFAGHEATLVMWHHTIHDISTFVSDAGLRIVSLHEPPVAGDTPSELLGESGKRRFISYLFLVLESPR